jgi:hypothetical protein
VDISQPPVKIAVDRRQVAPVKLGKGFGLMPGSLDQGRFVI